MNILYENTNILTRAKAYNLTYLLLSTHSESLLIINDIKWEKKRKKNIFFKMFDDLILRLFQAIERDIRRTSADPDENDLLHEALNRLTATLSSLLNGTLGIYSWNKKTKTIEMKNKSLLSLTH